MKKRVGKKGMEVGCTLVARCIIMEALSTVSLDCEGEEVWASKAHLVSPMILYQSATITKSYCGYCTWRIAWHQSWTCSLELHGCPNIGHQRHGKGIAVFKRGAY
jgi:hypothetical protein